MVEPVVTVRVDVTDDADVMVGDAGEKLAEAPPGKPEADKATVPVNPFDGVSVTV